MYAVLDDSEGRQWRVRDDRMRDEMETEDRIEERDAINRDKDENVDEVR